VLADGLTGAWSRLPHRWLTLVGVGLSEGQCVACAGSIGVVGSGRLAK
jgi:hypothetical protein